MKLKIRKISDNFRGLEKIEKGDWVDLSVCDSYIQPVIDNTIYYKAGETVFISLGFACELPEGYEAVIAPRSSTFKKTGLLLTNPPGVIDFFYRGNEDTWRAMFYATRNGKINIGQRLLHFRIQKKMPKLEFEYVDDLGNDNRGGYGSTGY